jgi:hypothetical protein
MLCPSPPVPSKGNPNFKRVLHPWARNLEKMFQYFEEDNWKFKRGLHTWKWSLHHLESGLNTWKSASLFGRRESKFQKGSTISTYLGLQIRKESKMSLQTWASILRRGASILWKVTAVLDKRESWSHEPERLSEMSGGQILVEPPRIHLTWDG